MGVRSPLPRKKAPSPTDQHVGARVRMRRKMLAMSQEQLAGALGISYQPSAEMRGRRQPRRGQPIAANLTCPSGATSAFLRGRAECISATRLQWRRVIDGRG